MGLQRRLVLVDLEEIVDVRVLLVLQHVEAQAPRLVPLRAEGVHLDGLEKALSLIRLDAHLDPHREHGGLLVGRVYFLRRTSSRGADQGYGLMSMSAGSATRVLIALGQMKS